VYRLGVHEFDQAIYEPVLDSLVLHNTKAGPIGPGGSRPGRDHYLGFDGNGRLATVEVVGAAALLEHYGELPVRDENDVLVGDAAEILREVRAATAAVGAGRTL